MRVVVSRTGGFAGLRLTWEVRVEQQPDPSDWYVLIDTIPWLDAANATNVSGAGEADRYVYDIRCDAPERTPPSYEVQLPERAIDGPWLELVTRVTEAGERLPPERLHPERHTGPADAGPV